MIAVNPQGNFQTRVILDIDEQLEFMDFFGDTENNSSLINECHLDVDDIVDEDNDVSIYADILLLPMVYEVVEPDSCWIEAIYNKYGIVLCLQSYE